MKTFAASTDIAEDSIRHEDSVFIRNRALYNTISKLKADPRIQACVSTIKSQWAKLPAEWVSELSPTFQNLGTDYNKNILQINLLGEKLQGDADKIEQLYKRLKSNGRAIRRHIKDNEVRRAAFHSMSKIRKAFKTIISKYDESFPIELDLAQQNYFETNQKISQEYRSRQFLQAKVAQYAHKAFMAEPKVKQLHARVISNLEEACVLLGGLCSSLTELNDKMQRKSPWHPEFAGHHAATYHHALLKCIDNLRKSEKYNQTRTNKQRTNIERKINKALAELNKLIIIYKQKIPAAKAKAVADIERLSQKEKAVRAKGTTPIYTDLGIDFGFNSLMQPTDRQFESRLGVSEEIQTLRREAFKGIALENVDFLIDAKELVAELRYNSPVASQKLQSLIAEYIDSDENDKINLDYVVIQAIKNASTTENLIEALNTARLSIEFVLRGQFMASKELLDTLSTLTVAHDPGSSQSARAETDTSEIDSIGSSSLSPPSSIHDSEEVGFIRFGAEKAVDLISETSSEQEETDALKPAQIKKRELQYLRQIQSVTNLKNRFEMLSKTQSDVRDSLSKRNMISAVR